MAIALLCVDTKICIPKVAISTHYKFPIHYSKVTGPWKDPDIFPCSEIIIQIIKYGNSLKIVRKNRESVRCLSTHCSVPTDFSGLWSADNILIDIYEGHWLIISNSSPLITHHWYYVHAYLLKTPIGLTTFLMQIRQQLSSPSMMQDLFVPNDIVWGTEYVIKSFPARMLSGWPPFHRFCIFLL